MLIKQNLFCKGSISSSSVGLWTGAFYAIIYVICRLPMTVLGAIKSNSPDALLAIISIPISSAQTGIVQFKQNIWAAIPYVGTAVKMYLTVIATMIEYLYSSVNMVLESVGDPSNKYKFNCEDPISLYGLYSFASQLTEGGGKTEFVSNILEKFGLKYILKCF